MTDVTFKTFEELDSHEGKGRFCFAGRSLGVTAWGMNLERFPAGYDQYPDHDHADDGQEEVYVVLEGDATLTADGESWSLAPGTMARVGARQRRKLVPGPGGVTMLVLGGTPGSVFEPRT
jgi:uncharacterized cupin superfamily protein